jgi:hypothetical protein
MPERSGKLTANKNSPTSARTTILQKKYFLIVAVQIKIFSSQQTYKLENLYIFPV